MGWFDEIGSWIGKNKDWLEPVVSIGTGALKQVNEDKAAAGYMDYLREREQQNYQSSVDQINAYNSQLAASGGGGRSGSGSNAAAAAAARTNEKRSRKASKKANDALQGTYKQILEMYAPYRATADKLLPQMTQTYQNSLGLQNALAQYVNSPAQVAKLDAAGPAWNVNVPLPDSVRLK